MATGSDSRRSARVVLQQDEPRVRGVGWRAGPPLYQRQAEHEPARVERLARVRRRSPLLAAFQGDGNGAFLRLIAAEDICKHSVVFETHFYLVLTNHRTMISRRFTVS